MHLISTEIPQTSNALINKSVVQLVYRFTVVVFIVNNSSHSLFINYYFTRHRIFGFVKMF